MALSLALPCCVYLILALVQPQSVWPVYLCIAIDQFGYGFGFTAYTLYMLYFSRGEFQTSHYAERQISIRQKKTSTAIAVKLRR